MENLPFSDDEAATALVGLIGSSRWDAVAIAHGYLALQQGATETEAARVIYTHGKLTLKRSRELIQQVEDEGFLGLLLPRQRIGSAENPITKLFPATVTEQRFLELLDELTGVRSTITYQDERESSHTLTDFTVFEYEYALPINIKN